MSTSRRPIALALAASLALAFSSQCRGPEPSSSTKDVSASWETVYRVLEHPRCMNCHPAGDVPLQGDDGRPHTQNVQRGPRGEGLFAMRCSTCHQSANATGVHLPPGAPRWQLPSPAMPLVFEGRSSSQLCRQLSDPRQNGNRTPAQLLEHVSSDPLVLWGWSPGAGRAPVPISHAEFVAAMRTWVDGGCACPQ
jgi:hypothetical protein